MSELLLVRYFTPTKTYTMKRLLLICAIIFSLSSVWSQDYLGIASSNYSGNIGLNLQPANLADNRLKLDIQLPSFNFFAGQNFIGFKPNYLVRNGNITSSDYPMLNPTPPTGDFTHAYFMDGRRAMVSANIEIIGAMFSLNEKNAVSFNVRERNYVNIDGVDKDLYQLAYNSLAYPALYNVNLYNKQLSIQTMSWMEYAFGYGRVLKDDGDHFLKVGGRVKALSGFQSAYLYVKDLKYQANSDSTISLDNATVEYGHSSNFEASQDPSRNSFRPSSKLGWGFDFGVVYEWRPDHEKYKYDMDGETNLWRRDQNKYKLRVGASLTDVGGILFNKGGQSGNFTASTTNWNLSALTIGGNNAVAGADSIISNQFGGTKTGANYRMNLPTAFSTQIDYHVWKDIYVNQTNFIAFSFKNNANKVHDFSTYSLTPRWDHRLIGFSVPFSYNALLGWRTGMALRLGPLYIGTSNLSPYRDFVRADGSGKRELLGADFYVGLHIPIAYKKVKDRDNDKVSDKRDECVKIPGTWEYRGCPDRDLDHIRDEEDKCPDVAGLKELNGCPDKDLDGVADQDDQCPDVAGVKELAGCPDRDGDGITDSKDDCPDDKGLAQFNGCPDRDEDGIMDRVDDCPDTKGLAQFNGCPDTDGDNIQDKLDACPTVFGIAELRGCPAPVLTYFAEAKEVEKSTESHGEFPFAAEVTTKTAKFAMTGYGTDTIKVAYVTAPNLRGKNAYREADGFFRFPKEAEAVVLKEEEKEVMKKAFDNLEFETGKDIIKPSSYAGLNELANLMVTYPTWKLRISGHTDNVGKRELNVQLSKKRSEAVKKYLMQKGLSADKFEVLYFGPDKPIAPNDTEEGRARNRRVEMLIVE